MLDRKHREVAAFLPQELFILGLNPQLKLLSLHKEQDMTSVLPLRPCRPQPLHCLVNTLLYTSVLRMFNFTQIRCYARRFLMDAFKTAVLKTFLAFPPSPENRGGRVGVRGTPTGPRTLPSAFLSVRP